MMKQVQRSFFLYLSPITATGSNQSEAMAGLAPGITAADTDNPRQQVSFSWRTSPSEDVKEHPAEVFVVGQGDIGRDRRVSLLEELRRREELFRLAERPRSIFRETSLDRCGEVDLVS